MIDDYIYFRRAVYGLNEIKIPIASVSSLFIREGLTPFYIFQIFSLTLWFLDEYIFYALTILSLSLAGIIQAVYQSRKVCYIFSSLTSMYSFF